MKINKVQYKMNPLFAKYTILMTDLEERLQMLVNMFSLVCEKRNMKLSVKKSRVYMV